MLGMCRGSPSIMSVNFTAKDNHLHHVPIQMLKILHEVSIIIMGRSYKCDICLLIIMEGYTSILANIAIEIEIFKL